MSVNGRPTRDFEGVFVDPLPAPRVIQPGRQAFVGYTRSYTDQLEDDLLRSEANVKTLEAQVLALSNQIKRQRERAVQSEAPSVATPSTPTPTADAAALTRARKTIEAQRQRIARLQESLHLLANQQRRETPAARYSPGRVAIGRLVIDVLHQRVELDDHWSEVTRNELAMLLYLAERLDELHDTASIGAAIGCRPGSVRTFMWRLRPKLERIGAQGYLHSRGRGGDWGGYWMTASHEEQS